MTRRGRWLLVLAGFLTLLAIVAVLVGVSVGSGRAIPRRAILWMDVGPDLVEEDRRGPIERLVRPKPLTLFDHLRVLRAAAADRRVAAAVVDLRGIGGGWAKADELREALAEFRKSGKPLRAFMEFGEVRDYFVATAAERVAMPPSGVLVVTGILADVPFFKRTLDKIGVQADLEHIGAYKSASDAYTRDSMSDPHRLALEAILDSLYGRFVAVVSRARSLSPDRVRTAVDEGFFNAGRAKAMGLLDDLAYRDEVLDAVEAKLGHDARRIRESAYLGALRGRPGGDRLALVHVSGVIAQGDSSSDAFGGATTGSDTVAAAVRRAREDPRVKGVLLRVDSPGGSALASDLIWREVEITRAKKPVVVSMSDLAASGGYYVAMGADAVVAGPATLTGSIGVISGKFSLRGLYDWIGLRRELIKRGENADLFSDYRPFTDAQRAVVRRQMEEFYRDFVHKAAKGRRKSDAEIDAVGQGRVWTGEQARARGLVDELGGVETAVEVLKSKAGIPKGTSIDLVVYPRPRGLLESIVSEEGPDDSPASRALRALLPPAFSRALGQFRILDRLSSEPYLLLDPDLCATR